MDSPIADIDFGVKVSSSPYPPPSCKGSQAPEERCRKSPKHELVRRICEASHDCVQAVVLPRVDFGWYEGERIEGSTGGGRGRRRRDWHTWILSETAFFGGGTWTRKLGVVAALTGPSIWHMQII